MEFRDRIIELRRIPACDLKPHPLNWRTHPAAQTSALRDVLTEIGFAGAELAFPADGLGPAGNFDDLMLIDGHARKDLAGQQVVPVLVTDLTAAEALKVLATFDPLGAMAEANTEKLDALLREVEFTSPAVAAMLAELASEAGLYLEESAGIVESAESQYTNKITAPIYEPKGEKPPIRDLSDKTKTNELCGEIEKAELPEDVRGFLLTAAQRHTVFNFRNIAEFYCHASADVQHLMERSGLIIIDMDKAIANGFVHLSERLGEIADLELSEAEDA
jgi:hypothetical protein